MKTINEFLKSKKVPFCAHESYVVNFHITNEIIHIRLAIDCSLNEEFGIKEDEYATSFYLIDAITKKFKITDYEFHSIEGQTDLQILDFSYKKKRYYLDVLTYDNYREAYIEFESDDFEYVPIKVISNDVLEHIHDKGFENLLYL